MLLTVQGYFEAGHFIADTPIQIPERRKTIVTVLDEKIDKENEQAKYITYWNKIIEDIQNSEEVLEDEPERIHLKPLDEIEGLEIVNWKE
jgi:predicted KAP-like P-loop ATPase